MSPRKFKTPMRATPKSRGRAGAARAGKVSAMQRSQKQRGLKIYNSALAATQEIIHKFEAGAKVSLDRLDKALAKVDSALEPTNAFVKSNFDEDGVMDSVCVDRLRRLESAQLQDMKTLNGFSEAKDMKVLINDRANQRMKEIVVVTVESLRQMTSQK